MHEIFKMHFKLLLIHFSSRYLKCASNGFGAELTSIWGPLVLQSTFPLNPPVSHMRKHADITYRRGGGYTRLLKV